MPPAHPLAERVAAVPVPAPAEDLRLAAVDLEPAIRALDPAYLDTLRALRAHHARLTTIAACARAGELYAVVGEGHVFVSRDGMHTLAEVAEINRCGEALVDPAYRAIDLVVETVEGTVLALGRDRFDGTAEGLRQAPGAERSVVWRRARGETRFVRGAVGAPGWPTGKNGNIASGYFGPHRAPTVAFVPYTDGGARIVTSTDDGRTWRAHDVSAYFQHHAHEIHLPQSVGNERVARMWVTGGDDPTGARSGLVCFPGLDDAGGLLPGQWVVREAAGFRLVGLAGNGKHVYVGNESLAGGVLRIQDNAEAIAGGDVEVCIGKARHDYHQFRSLVASVDGLVVSGTDSYRQYAGDTVRADAGGYLYVSTNEGASAAAIALGGTWIVGVVDDGTSIWCATSGTSSSGPDVSLHALKLFRLRRPDALVPLIPPFAAKVVMADSSRFYAMAGYAEAPAPALAAGACTWRVDMSCWPWLAIDVLARSDGELAVEGLAYSTWRLDEDAWHTVATFAVRAGQRVVLPLPPAALACRWLRARNVGTSALDVGAIAFVGRR